MAYKTPVNIGTDIAMFKLVFFSHLAENVMLIESICRFRQ